MPKSKSNNWDSVSETLRRAQSKDNAYVKFGKFLLTHLKLIDNPDELDWLAITKRFTSLNMVRQPGLMRINWVVATEYELDPTLVRFNTTKKRSLIEPRQVSMFLANRLFKHTQEDINEFYNKTGHSRVSSACTAVDKLILTDRYTLKRIENITNILLGYTA